MEIEVKEGSVSRGEGRGGEEGGGDEVGKLWKSEVLVSEGGLCRRGGEKEEERDKGKGRTKEKGEKGGRRRKENKHAFVLHIPPLLSLSPP